jgi:predicted dienelactone hydrolase
MLRRRAATSFAALLLVLAGCSSDAPGANGAPEDGAAGSDSGTVSRLLAYAPPGELGPFPIGAVALPFVDDSRLELSTLDASDPRTLPSVVWYPAAEAARGMPKAVRGDFLPRPIAELLGGAGSPALDIPTESVFDVPVAEDGPFPLIVFSHGNGGLGVQSFFLTEFLASHGYIVVCPDHTGNAMMTELPDGTVVPQGGEAGTSYANALPDRVADASFLVDAMGSLHASDPGGRFTGAVDLDRVGITGHSFGGLTSLLAIEADRRFDAAAPMAPAAPESSDIDRPVMYFWATEDQTLPYAPVAANYEAARGPKMLVSITDAGHFSFSNGCPYGIGNGDGCGTATRDSGETFTFLPDTRVHEITLFYQTALWGYYLKEIAAYADDLDAEPFPEDVAIQRDGMP